MAGVNVALVAKIVVLFAVTKLFGDKGWEWLPDVTVLVAANAARDPSGSGCTGAGFQRRRRRARRPAGRPVRQRLSTSTLEHTDGDNWFGRAGDFRRHPGGLAPRTLVRTVVAELQREYLLDS